MPTVPLPVRYEYLFASLAPLENSHPEAPLAVPGHLNP